MSEWKTTTFGDLIESGILEIGDGYRAKNAELEGEGFIFLRAGHVTDTHIDFEGVDRFKTEYHSRVRNKLSLPHDVVVTTKGNSTGRVTYVGDDLPQFVYSPHLSYWRSLKHELLCPGFLRQWSRGYEFHGQLNALKASTDMAPYLSLRDQRSLRITLPSPSVQHRIADILGALDDKIELNRRMNRTLEAMAQALYRHWFVEEAFDVVPLTEVVQLKPRLRLTRGKEATYIGMSALSTTGMSVEEVERKEYKSGTKFQNDDTLLARITPCLENGKTAFVDFLADGEIGFGSTEFIVMRALPKVSSYFVYTLARDPDFRAYAMQTMVGTSGRQRVQEDDLKRFEVGIGDAETMSRFHQQVKPWFRRIRANVCENQTLAQTRDYLLPKLLSGEIEVEAAEEQVAEVV